MRDDLLRRETFRVPALQIGGRLRRALRVHDREQLVPARIAVDPAKPEGKNFFELMAS